MRKSERYIVIVESGPLKRAFDVYRSFKTAEADASAWGGYVLPLEKTDASEPWDHGPLFRSKATAQKQRHRSEVRPPLESKAGVQKYRHRSR